MFACASGGTAGGAANSAALTLGDILTFLGNVATMAVNYLLDLLIPYTPPTACDGPFIYDGAEQSCADVNIPCAADLSEMCLNIDDLTQVSNAFKQCMGGRCGCGG